MIKVITSAAQTLAPGEAIAFDLTSVHTNCGRSERHQDGSAFVRLLANGVYEVAFDGNIGATAPGAAQVSLREDGEIVGGTNAISTTAAAGDLNNVSINTPIRNICCGCNRIAVANTGMTTITVGAGASLFVKRIG